MAPLWAVLVIAVLFHGIDGSWYGHEVESRRFYISYAAQKTYIIEDIELGAGTLNQISFYAHDLLRDEHSSQKCVISLQIWEMSQVLAEGWKLQWMRNVTVEPRKSGEITVEIPSTESYITHGEGTERLGFTYGQDFGIIAFEYISIGRVRYKTVEMGTLYVGTELSFDEGVQSTVFSIQANIGDSMEGCDQDDRIRCAEYCEKSYSYGWIPIQGKECSPCECQHVCDNENCGEGSECQPQEVTCFTAPCLPVPQCVSEPTTTPIVDCGEDEKLECYYMCEYQQYGLIPQQGTECTGCQCEDVCKDKYCEEGTVCEPQMEFCFRAPCPPQPHCVQEPTTTPLQSTTTDWRFWETTTPPPTPPTTTSETITHSWHGKSTPTPTESTDDWWWSPTTIPWWDRTTKTTPKVNTDDDMVTPRSSTPSWWERTTYPWWYETTTTPKVNTDDDMVTPRSSTPSWWERTTYPWWYETTTTPKVNTDDDMLTPRSSTPSWWEWTTYPWWWNTTTTVPWWDETTTTFGKLHMDCPQYPDYYDYQPTGCPLGFHGDYCDMQCSATCNMCMCNMQYGYCSKGCIDGYHGPYCEYRCSEYDPDCWKYCQGEECVDVDPSAGNTNAAAKLGIFTAVWICILF